MKLTFYFFLIINYAMCQNTLKFETLNISLPNKVEKLNKEEKEKLFKNNFDVPDIIFSDKNANASISFKKTIANIPLGGLKDVKTSFVKQFQHPKVTILRDEIIQIENKDFILINVQIDSPTGRVNITNLSTDIKGNLVIITISHMSYSSGWDKITKEFINSIKVEK